MISVAECDWYTWTYCCHRLFSLLFKKTNYDMTLHNIYHFPFPTYSQKNVDVVAVCRVAGQC